MRKINPALGEPAAQPKSRKPIDPKEHAMVMAIAAALDIAASLARQLPIKPYAYELSYVNDAHSVWDDVRGATNARFMKESEPPRKK